MNDKEKKREQRHDLNQKQDNHKKAKFQNISDQRWRSSERRSFRKH